ncbi:uncharacterized abhydrolase domain-containing protein DDB_G0269086-like [Ceratina calcarata]|uniref:Uncharacterized abhydrolase domain-containing protein DDB_G0269086-like n=1 Tax=Ceratina calcarata TaxID=156304 RepID=A0AAJ7J450_9HYME|nr:uncharacterized abhydrolase domain-containing protein DDB_G0269086-like [Ceratina calcarata]
MEMEKNDDSPEDVKRATSVNREIKKGLKDDTFEGYPRVVERKKRWEHCDKAVTKKSKQTEKSNGDCCQADRKRRKRGRKFLMVPIAGEPCVLSKQDIIPRHCLTKKEHIDILATSSRRCPIECRQKMVLRKLKPVSQRIKELAHPVRHRMLITLQEGASILPPALLDNLVQTVEHETCLTPEQAAKVSRKKKPRDKKRKGKPEMWHSKETKQLKKTTVGITSPGAFDKDAITCQYIMAERFVRSILKWRGSLPKEEISDVTEVIVKRLTQVLEYTPTQSEDRKSQQMRFLADVIASWVTGVVSEVAEYQEEKMRERCKKKEEELREAEEELRDWEESEDEDEDRYKPKRDEYIEEEEEEEEEEDVEEEIEEEPEKEEEVEGEIEYEVQEAEITLEEEEEELEVTEIELAVDVETETQVESEVQIETEIQTEEKPVAEAEVEATELEAEVAAGEAAAAEAAAAEAAAAEAAAAEAAAAEAAAAEAAAAEAAAAEAAAAEAAAAEAAAAEAAAAEAAAAEAAAAEAAAAEAAAAEAAAAEATATEAAAAEATATEAATAEAAATEAATAEAAAAEAAVAEAAAAEAAAAEAVTAEAAAAEAAAAETAAAEAAAAEAAAAEEEPAPPETIIGEEEEIPKEPSIIRVEKDVSKEIDIMKGLEELLKTDLPFLTFDKIIDAVYKMIESMPENAGEDPITNGIHRAIYEKLSNIVLLEDPDLLTEELKTIMNVVCGKIANWLRSILTKSQLAFMEKYMPEVESKEIRDWTRWLEYISDVAKDWNVWLRSVIEKIFEMKHEDITRGEWHDWTKSVDTKALLWRRFHLQTLHQAQRHVTLLLGRHVVKTGMKGFIAPDTSERLITTTDLRAPSEA